MKLLIVDFRLVMNLADIEEHAANIITLAKKAKGVEQWTLPITPRSKRN